MSYHSNSSFIYYSMYLLVSMCGERNSHEREKGNRRAKFEFRPRQLHSLSHKCHRENYKAITSSLSYGLNSCIEWQRVQENIYVEFKTVDESTENYFSIFAKNYW